MHFHFFPSLWQFVLFRLQICLYIRFVFSFFNCSKITNFVKLIYYLWSTHFYGDFRNTVQGFTVHISESVLDSSTLLELQMWEVRVLARAWLHKCSKCYLYLFRLFANVPIGSWLLPRLSSTSTGTRQGERYLKIPTCFFVRIIHFFLHSSFFNRNFAEQFRLFFAFDKQNWPLLMT